MGFEAVVSKASRLMMRVAGVMLLGMMLLTTGNVVARYAFNSPVFGQSELVQFMQLVAISLAGGYTLLMRRHVTIGLVVDHLKIRTQNLFDAITYLLSLGFCVVAVWKTIERANELVGSGASTSILKITLAPWYYIMSLGWLLIALCAVMVVVDCIRKVIKP